MMMKKVNIEKFLVTNNIQAILDQSYNHAFVVIHRYHYFVAFDISVFQQIT